VNAINWPELIDHANNVMLKHELICDVLTIQGFDLSRIQDSVILLEEVYEVYKAHWEQIK